MINKHDDVVANLNSPPLTAKQIILSLFIITGAVLCTAKELKNGWQKMFKPDNHITQPAPAKIPLNF